MSDNTKKKKQFRLPLYILQHIFSDLSSTFAKFLKKFFQARKHALMNKENSAVCGTTVIRHHNFELERKNQRKNNV